MWKPYDLNGVFMLVLIEERIIFVTGRAVVVFHKFVNILGYFL